MSDISQQDSSLSQMNDLFGEPPLIKGEDKARYLRLLAAIENELQPKTVFDRIYAREYTDKLWQQQRCKQSAASIVESAYIEALADLLRPFDLPMIFGKDPATEMARDYFSGESNNKRLEEVETRLAVLSISTEQIRAKAMQLCGNGVLMFNRMETNCETSLRMLRKESDRRPAVGAAKVPGSPEKGDEVIQ
jgi:hypothetical protein